MTKSIMDYPSLETDRLNLQILNLEDAKAVFTHFSDPDVTEFMDINPCKNIEEAEEIINFHLQDTGCRWGVFAKDSSELMGTLGYHYIRRTTDEFIAEIGFDLAKRYWGKGIMSEAIREVIAYGFNQMGLTKIDATVEPENQRSIQLMTKLGFTREEELQDNLIYFYLKK
ncbi:GNAT family N-acetyltransferase [Neobacillus sp. D3-1R]|uniref:GNAT family N-acetyltransferase n=1 Tax=Neobacillus sp. D3-1R TaxID=3445778 RepID=UPI003FA1364D